MDLHINMHPDIAHIKKNMPKKMITFKKTHVAELEKACSNLRCFTEIFSRFFVDRLFRYAFLDKSTKTLPQCKAIINWKEKKEKSNELEIIRM